MSTTVKMVGFCHKFSSQKQEDVQKVYESMGYKFKDPDPTYPDFIEDNEHIFYARYEDNLHKWIPFIDYEGTFGVVYITEYERDASYVCEIFRKDREIPKFQGEETTPFVILYYNGVDNPLTF